MAETEQRVKRRGGLPADVGQWVSALVVTLLVVLIGACVRPGDLTGTDIPPCDCPNLVQIVESIDWVPGAVGEQRSGTASDDQTRRSVTYEFEIRDAVGEVERLQGTFEQDGLPIEELSSDRGFRSVGAGYVVRISILDGKLRVNVALVDSAPDEQAASLLRPVIDALTPDG